MNGSGCGSKRRLGRRDFLRRLGAGALGLTALGGAGALGGTAAAKKTGGTAGSSSRVAATAKRTGGTAGSSSRVAAGKPNFVIVFTDDQAYGDVGCFGAKAAW